MVEEGRGIPNGIKLTSIIFSFHAIIILGYTLFIFMVARNLFGLVQGLILLIFVILNLTTAIGLWRCRSKARKLALVIGFLHTIIAMVILGYVTVLTGFGLPKWTIFLALAYLILMGLVTSYLLFNKNVKETFNPLSI